MTWTVARGIHARQEAAKRLPPLACGCRDVFSDRHINDRCRYRRGGRRDH